MNEPQDPFESFLEDALSGPDDLDLGHEMRRRLLEAAVAGDSVAKENVVPFERPDPEIAAGFDWLVGETPATRPLMERMIRDSGFLDMLDGERSFLHTLRASLSQPAAAAATMAPGRRRFMPFATISAAAALALAAGTVFFNRGDTGVATPVVVSSGPAGTGASGSPVVAGAGPALEIASNSIGIAPSVVVLPAPVVPAPVPLIVPGNPGFPADESPVIAHLGGSGQSLPADDPLLAPAGDISLPALAESAQLVANDLSLSPDDSSQSIASLSNTGSLWRVGGMDSTISFATGPSFGFNTDKAGSIPEVGGALPVMIGFMVLLMRRPHRRREQA